MGIVNTTNEFKEPSFNIGAKVSDDQKKVGGIEGNFAALNAAVLVSKEAQSNVWIIFLALLTSKNANIVDDATLEENALVRTCYI